MALTQFQQELRLITFTLEETRDVLIHGEMEDVEYHYKRLCESVKKLESIKGTGAAELMDDEDNTVEVIRQWTQQRNDEMKEVREMRTKVKRRLQSLEDEQTKQRENTQLESQRRIAEEQARFQRQQQQEMEQAKEQQQQREEAWYKRRAELEMELLQNKTKELETQPQAVKLQRYTITPFEGDFKDWIRFWNQFEVEVDKSRLSEISKFNYLLELVKGRPRDDVLGLPHTVEGYEEAKRILKANYGKDIKVHKALIKELENLPVITNRTWLRDIHEFYNTFARVVRTLKTMNKIDTVQSHIYGIFDKLGPVREAIVQKEDKWEEWKLEDLMEHLRRYVDRNPLVERETAKPQQDKRHVSLQEKPDKNERVMFSNNFTERKKTCVYCSSDSHRSNECTKVLSVANRKEFLRKNKLCFNCTGGQHTAAKCRAGVCRKCRSKHHTSLCENTTSTIPNSEPRTFFDKSADKSMGVVEKTTTIHATVVCKVNGIDARIMIDNGASSSYICTELLSSLRLKPARYERKLIEQMYGTVEKRVERYTVEISSSAMKHFKFNVDCINAEKEILTHVANPNIREIKRSQPRLSPLQFSEENSMGETLPVHIVLGVADYQRIKTTEPPVLGKDPDKDPGAELTMLGWVLQGGTTTRQSDIEHTFLLNTTHDELDKLCSMEVLGIKDETVSCSVSDEEFLKQFNSNLHIAESGRYSTRLPWKSDCADLPTNKDLAKKRLISTTRRLEKTGRLIEYDGVMRDHIKQGIIEEVKDESTNAVEHYIPHHAVIRDEAESTKMRVVYDCSAKQDNDSPSLNDCLEVGPALQPHLFDVLLGNRMKSYCLTGDIKQAFLQIEVDAIDRDALRLFWYKDLTTKEIVTYRFTRVIFGSASSPFILGATLNKHVSSYCHDYPQTAKGLLENTYVDDIQFVSDEQQELHKFKRESTEILSSAGFTLHKWHSNVVELENNDNVCIDNSETTANGLVGARNNETKLLGVPWNKESDEISVDFSKCLERSETQCVTKRTIISVINSIFDVLGFITPVLIIAKLLFSKVCTLKLTWDEEIPSDLLRQWQRWIKELKQCLCVSVPRCCFLRASSRQIFLHGFSDASKHAVCAAVYVVGQSVDGTSSQHLLVSKSRVTPKGLSIPRLELVGALLLVKLLTHVKQTLKDCHFERIHGWTDSTTVLYWLNSRGTWSKFVRNRVKKMAEADFIGWHHVPTADNPSDLGTRGAYPRQLNSLWFHGPTWLTDNNNWPKQPELLECDSTLQETARSGLPTLLACDKENLAPEFQELLQRPYWQMLRITAYVKRFINNCLHPQMKVTCALTTEEINSAETTWFYMVQTTIDKETRAELVGGDDNLLRRDSRIPGYTPIHLPREHLFTTRLIEHEHAKSLHGGVNVTMCRIRNKLWIPKLRSLVKSVIHKCNKCKRFRAQPVGTPPTSNLPRFRTELTTPFDVTGVDFAGPLLYKTVNGESSKCYVALFTCTCTRAIHLKLCKDLSAEAFQHALREFVARRGTPSMMVSDNGKNFVATGKWIKTLKYDDNVMNFLAANRIKWRFNLARAPWWGGFFERLIGIMKRALSKVIGKGLLTYEELEDVLLDVECHVNNRPLTYQGEEVEQPVLTPNILIRGAPTAFLEEDIEQLDEDTVTTRRIAHLQKCKQDLKKRWTTEYLQTLEEKQASREKSEEYQIPRINSVVLLKEDTKKRVQWKLGRVLREIHGKDGVARGLEIKLGNGYIVQRPLQLICNLEITPCDDELQPARVADVGQAEQPVPQRNRRAAADLARAKITAMIQDEQEET